MESSDLLSGYNVHKSPSIFNLGLIFLTVTPIFFNFDSLVLDWDSWLFIRWVPRLTITICNKVTLVGRKIDAVHSWHSIMTVFRVHGIVSLKLLLVFCLMNLHIQGLLGQYIFLHILCLLINYVVNIQSLSFTCTDSKVRYIV